MGSTPSKTKSETKESEQGFSSTDSHTEEALVEKVVVLKADENDMDNYGQKESGSRDGSEDAVLKAANDLDKDEIPEGSGPIESKYYRTAQGCSKSRKMGSKPSKTKSETKEPEQGFSSTDSHTEDALIEKVENVVLKADDNDMDNYSQKESGSRDPSEDPVLKAVNDLDKDVTPEGSGPIESKEQPKGARMENLADTGTMEKSLKILFPSLTFRVANTIEKDCSFYMRNGTCKYGSHCVCNHPDPTPMTGMGSSNSSADDKFGRQLSHPLEKHNDLPIHFSGASQLDQASRILYTSSDNTTSYPNCRSSYVTPYTPPQHMRKQSERNGYEAPDSHQSANYSAAPAADGSLRKSYITMPNEEFPERPGHPKCDNFVKPGKCKFSSTRRQGPKDRKPKPDEHILSEKGLPLRPPKGATTEYLADTGREESQNIVPELNFLGLPIRLGEKDCPFYMRNGTCKYGSRCLCNHPDPTPMTGMGSSNSSADDKFGRQLSHPLEKHNDLPIHFSGASQPDQASRILYTSSDNTSSYPSSCSSYVTPYTPPPEQMQKQSEWNGYEAPDFHQSANYSATPTADGSLRKSYITMPDEEFLERPGHPKCNNFVKSGNGKFSSTRRHSPKGRKPKPDEHVLSEKGLPLRPSASTENLADIGREESQNIVPELNFLGFPTRLGPDSHQSANYSATPAADGPLRKSYISMPDEEFPQRPGHPECDNFVKSGNCKRSARHRGPKDRKPKPDEHVLSEKCLPLRPPKGASTENLADIGREESQNIVPELNFLGLPTRLAPDSHQSATPVADGSLRKSYISMPDKEFPERPGHPECDNLVKSGNCKRSALRHGLKDRKPKPDEHVLSEKGLPLRPPKGASMENLADTGGEESRNIVPELNFLGLPTRLAPDSHQSANYSATPAADGSLRKSYITMPDEKFPERPGHPKCNNFVKSGNLKFRSTRRHGPKGRKPKPDEHILSEKGLPLRPGRSVCRHYERHGDCKFGNACHFDHPVSHGLATYPDLDASKTSADSDAGSWGD